jgi:hypothetical protein
MMSSFLELATIFKDSTVGHSPVPAAKIALAIILQAYLGISDDEVIEEMSPGSTLAVSSGLSQV